MLLEDWDGTWLDIFKKLKPGNIIYFRSVKTGENLAPYIILYGKTVSRFDWSDSVYTYEKNLNKCSMSKDYFIDVATPNEILEAYRDLFSTDSKHKYAKLIVQRILEDAV